MGTVRRGRRVVVALAITLGGCETLLGHPFDDRHPPSDALAAGGVEDGPGPSAGAPMSNDDPILASGGNTNRTPVAGAGADTASQGKADDVSAGGAKETGAGGDGPGGSSIDCGTPLVWEHVEFAEAFAPRALPPKTLARTIGVVRHVGGVSCEAALLTPWWILSAGCQPKAGDEFVLNLQRESGWPATSLAVVVSVQDEYEQGPDYAIDTLSTAVDFRSHPMLPWEPRPLRVGEILTFISHDGDGLARTASARLSSDPPLRLSNPSSARATFAEDGRLIGFCNTDACGAVLGFLSLADLVMRSETLRTTWNAYGIRWADATGDGRADALVINRDAIALALSGPGGLSPTSILADDRFAGSVGALFADFSGDGLADLAVVGEEGVVVRAAADAFLSKSDWSAISFMPSQKLLAGDVDGVVGVDLLVFRGGAAELLLSEGSRFSDPVPFAADLPDSRSQALADVTGDGLADLVLVVEHGIRVLPSSGSSFVEGANWLSNAEVAEPGWFFGDVSGDGRDDAVAIDVSGTRVFLSDGERFIETVWGGNVPIGERETSLADATGDGLADAIVENHDNIVVYPSTGRGFAPGVRWRDGQYYGGL